MTTDEFIKLAAVLFLFLGGALTAVLAFSQVRNSNNAKAINDLTQSVIDQNKEIDRLSDKIVEKDTEISKLKLRIEELERELEGRGKRRPLRQMGQA